VWTLALAYQSIDELTDMKPIQRGTSGSKDVRHALISTCEATGYRQVHGLVDLTQESLLGALGWAKSSPSPRPTNAN
jgi:hypothetical protein